ncbi:MAG TPA: hypothetical protein VN516_01820, partial [Candidatus Baltobacteraceae bacterium]|nr:hypothetical protein [Candidatus Baltobacteraceae bacterium]
AGAIIAVINLNRIVKKGIEVYGPEITKVSVSVDSVNIGVFTGSADIKGLIVGNPKGYKTPHAISVGEISAGVNPLTLTKDKIVVRSIKVISPEITFEGGLGGNNLMTIKNNVSGTPQPGGSTVVTNSVGQPKKSKNLEVDDVLISGAKVTGVISVFGKDMPVKNLPIPTIHLTNLGKDPKGITPADLTKRILDAIAMETIQTLGKYATNLGSGATNLGTTNLNRIKKGIGDLLK